ncbi:hypothetical protein BJV77DRAFT_1154339, partial [Russula vinacea]
MAKPSALQLPVLRLATAILSVLQDLIQQFDRRRRSDERLTNWLNPTVNVLYAFLSTIGQELAFSPANVVFSGIGVLLLAAKDVDASQDVLIDIFVRIECFFKRLESYTEVRPTAAMSDVIVKIIIEVLSILAIATKEIKQGRSKKFLKKLLGKNNLEDALKKLDTLTMEELGWRSRKRGRYSQQGDDKVTVLFDTNEREKLKNWLSPPDPSTNHNIARKIHHKGTTSWFFQGSIFKQWKSSPLLWVHGKPGSGKSVLCSGVIEDIKAQHEAGSAIMAYFYCDFRDEDKQTAAASSSLSYLSYALSPIFVATYSLAHTWHTTREHKDPMVSLLVEGPIYLIVDALDECPNNSGLPPQEKSRPEIDIQSALERLTTLCVSLHNQTGQKEDI